MFPTTAKRDRCQRHGSTHGAGSQRLRAGVSGLRLRHRQRRFSERNNVGEGRQRSKNQAEKRNEMPNYVQLGEVRTHYEEDGNGEPLVLLHPGGADSRAWGLNVPGLVEHFH